MNAQVFATSDYSTVTNSSQQFGTATFTVNATTNVATLASGDLPTGFGPFRLTTSTTLPAPLALATDYYWVRTGAGTGKFATSLANARAGTTVDLTNTGTGTHTLNRLMQPGELYVLTCSVAAWVAQGSNPTASAADGNIYVPADTPTLIDGTQGEKLAVLRVGSNDGVATLAKLKAL